MSKKPPGWYAFATLEYACAALFIVTVIKLILFLNRLF